MKDSENERRGEETKWGGSTGGGEGEEEDEGEKDRDKKKVH
jgi:hypothetical protein